MDEAIVFGTSRNGEPAVLVINEDAAPFVDAKLLGQPQWDRDTQVPILDVSDPSRDSHQFVAAFVQRNTKDEIAIDTLDRALNRNEIIHHEIRTPAAARAGALVPSYRT